MTERAYADEKKAPTGKTKRKILNDTCKCRDFMMRYFSVVLFLPIYSEKVKYEYTNVVRQHFLFVSFVCLDPCCVLVVLRLVASYN